MTIVQKKNREIIPIITCLVHFWKFSGWRVVPPASNKHPTNKFV